MLGYISLIVEEKECSKWFNWKEIKLSCNFILMIIGVGYVITDQK